MYNTKTATYTVVDIRKTFESFKADLKMIARRTNTWSQENVDKASHDIIKLAEAKYLDYVDVVLLNNDGNVIRASRFKVALDGKSMVGDRAGGNNWQSLEGGDLTIVVHYQKNWGYLSDTQKDKFRSDNEFKCNWSNSTIDTSYPHLNAEKAQTYASKGYELSRINFI